MDSQESSGKEKRDSKAAPQTKITDLWATPREVFDRIEDWLGPFQLDVCANPETAKCARYFSEKHNGLRQDWAKKNYCNPPYSDVTPWLQKGWEERKKGNRTVYLLKNDPSTGWWKKYISPEIGYFPFTMRTYPNVELYHWPKRIKFEMPDLLRKRLEKERGEKIKVSTPTWSSVIVVFEP